MAERIVEQFSLSSSESGVTYEPHLSRDALVREALRGDVYTEDVQDHCLAGPIETIIFSYADERSSGRINRDRYEGRLVSFVDANIFKWHLNTGEDTSRSDALAGIIRDRGIASRDQCGHIVGRQLGGRMVDFNLFPQDASLNMGSRGSYAVWKQLEAAMRVFLALVSERFRPRIEFSMLLQYNPRGRKPMRPIGCKYLVKFYITNRAGQEPEEIKVFDVCGKFLNVMRNVFTGKFSTQNLRTQIKNFVADHGLSHECKVQLLENLRELIEILDIIDPPPPQGPSFWEILLRFVPIVGPIKMIYDGAGAVVEGEYAAGALEAAMGGLSLAADMVTIGGASGLVRGGAAAATAATAGKLSRSSSLASLSTRASLSLLK